MTAPAVQTTATGDVARSNQVYNIHPLVRLQRPETFCQGAETQNDIFPHLQLATWNVFIMENIFTIIPFYLYNRHNNLLNILRVNIGFINIYKCILAISFP